MNIFIVYFQQYVFFRDWGRQQTHSWKLLFFINLRACSSYIHPSIHYRSRPAGSWHCFHTWISFWDYFGPIGILLSFLQLFCPEPLLLSTYSYCMSLFYVGVSLFLCEWVCVVALLLGLDANQAVSFIVFCLQCVLCVPIHVHLASQNSFLPCELPPPPYTTQPPK